MLETWILLTSKLSLDLKESSISLILAHKQQRPFHYGYVSDIRKKLKIKTTESCGQIVSLVLYFEKKIFHYAEDKSVSR